jgi:hypothetical protein
LTGLSRESTTWYFIYLDSSNRLSKFIISTMTNI